MPVTADTNRTEGRNDHRHYVADAISTVIVDVEGAVVEMREAQLSWVQEHEAGATAAAVIVRKLRAQLGGGKHD